jgi:hypothetical protein
VECRFVGIELTHKATHTYVIVSQVYAEFEDARMFMHQTFTKPNRFVNASASFQPSTTLPIKVGKIA